MDPFGGRLEDLSTLWGLIDIKPKNGIYTWRNKRIRPGHIAARLDRVLVSTHLLKNLPFLESKLLCSAVSDHKNLCLFFPSVENLGPLPFRFNHLWLESEGVRDIIHKAWLCFILCSPAFIWEQKLEMVKAALKLWAAQHY